MIKPTYSFTIPSCSDDRSLECRLYHPENLAQRLRDNESAPSTIRGAVVAHPYAPLGGCYDDWVVLATVETLLSQDYVVGTFNFRGAGGSGGRTSWTGQPEVEDYVSMVGLVLYYVHFLNRPLSETDFDGGTGASTRRSFPEKQPIELLLGGYSYGSLVLASLPVIREIIDRFESAEYPSPAAKISLQARDFAKSTRPTPQGMKDQSSPPAKGTDDLPKAPKASGAGDDRPSTAVRYLLISPVLLPMTNTLAPPGLPFGGLSLAKRSEKSPLSFPTLAVFGSRDAFTSGRRLCQWAAANEDAAGNFQWTQIEEAGHFWHEPGAMQALQARIKGWVETKAESDHEK